MEYKHENQGDTLLSRIRAALGLPEKDPRQLSPLVLAYVGDTVYDLYVRTRLILSSDATAHGLHMQATRLVCAWAQAAALHAIVDTLSEDELAVYKRGRNSHMGTVPKNAAIQDYRAATGLEALLGYLYLRGQDARLTELMALILPPKEENHG
ncbi:MAG: ribonuclease III domain-containing protein [Candidatus Pelethousia sp.]|nr:ribonuclease III domain-containing protein [Candidatus Pelethousia sp.]